VCAELLERFRQPVLVEEFLSGREFTVGILGTGAEARALATLEVVLLAGADAAGYSYRNKTEWQSLVGYELLAACNLRTEVEQVALAAWRCLGCRDAGRVDIRLDGAGRAQFIEVNPLAGLTPGYSDLPLMAERSGMSYGALIGEILRCAQARLDAS
jgi:D-alanine-D-alanine ligase